MSKDDPVKWVLPTELADEVEQKFRELGRNMAEEITAGLLEYERDKVLDFLWHASCPSCNQLLRAARCSCWRCQYVRPLVARYDKE